MEKKEAMKILKDFYDKSALFSIRTALDTVIPELKESEDEKIRKALIDYFDDANKADENPLQSYGVHTDKAIAWLEKQGEQKPVDKVVPKFKVGDKIFEKDFYECGCGTIIDIKEGKYIFDNGGFIFIEEQGLWKLVEPIEQKFKVGDWVVTDKGDTVKIGAVNNGYYTMYNGMDFNMSYVDKCWHRWTIRDAKDGDVLAYGDNSNDHHVEVIMIFKSLRNEQSVFNHFHIFNDNFRIDDWSDCGKNAHPATKEQRDKLEKAMADVGFTFDFEKKKLKEVEPKTAEWSEEDENRFRNLIYLVEHSDEGKATKEGFVKFIKGFKKYMKGE